MITFLLRKNKENTLNEAFELLIHIHKYRMETYLENKASSSSSQTYDISCDIMAYCFFLEKTIVEYGVVDWNHEVPTFLLYKTIKSLEKSNPEKTKLLTSSLMNTISRVVHSENYGKHSFALAILALDLLSAGEERLPIEKRFSTHQLVSQLLLFAFNSIQTPAETLDFFRFYTRFMQMSSSNEKTPSLVFNLYSKKSLFTGSILDFTSRVLQKTLNALLQLDKEANPSIINVVANLVIFSYLVCPDYCSSSKCKIPKSFVIAALKCLFQFEEGYVRSLQLIADLVSTSTLQGDFLLDMVAEIAAVKDISHAEAYTNIFIYNTALNKVDWETILLMIKKADSFFVINEELSSFIDIYAQFLDSQYLLHEQAGDSRNVSLRPIADLYLHLLSRSPKMNVALNLLIDIIKNPLSYTEPGKTRHYMLTVLKTVAQRISELSYSKEDLEENKIPSIISMYQDVLATLTAQEQEDFLITLHQIQGKTP